MEQQIEWLKTMLFNLAKDRIINSYMEADSCCGRISGETIDKTIKALPRKPILVDPEKGLEALGKFVNSLVLEIPKELKEVDDWDKYDILDLLYLPTETLKKLKENAKNNN